MISLLACCSMIQVRIPLMYTLFILHFETYVRKLCLNKIYMKYILKHYILSIFFEKSFSIILTIIKRIETVIDLVKKETYKRNIPTLWAQASLPSFDQSFKFLISCNTLSTYFWSSQTTVQF